ncbi:hypothetical protein VTL71DRAFT_302 [Oculimacula yallundae]|uniref:Uncharacterized protein n=1 Tax=Oculimacula yallundae TaxID=86028 RepID=A0ABR4CZM6_9HELO
MTTNDDNDPFPLLLPFDVQDMTAVWGEQHLPLGLRGNSTPFTVTTEAVYDFRSCNYNCTSKGVGIKRGGSDALIFGTIISRIFVCLRGGKGWRLEQRTHLAR